MNAEKGASHHLPVAAGDTAPAAGRGLQTNGGWHLFPSAVCDLLRAETGDAEPVLCLESGTRVDAGWWLRRAPVWLCITPDRVAVVVAGRRHHVASVPRAACRGTRYDHATGEVVIEPGEALRFDRLSFPPREALRILHLLGAET